MFLDIVLHQFLKIRKTNKTNKQKKNNTESQMTKLVEDYI